MSGADPIDWRDRAAEMRVLADTMKDNETWRIINQLADDYDILADRAQRRSRHKRAKSSAAPLIIAAATPEGLNAIGWHFF